ncbi:BIRC4 [Mytilus edulis]|uniref:XIAP n=1 Tax=Mytilus edulis TaxID=6550 RepID=A0A8S3QJQ8_MYTED|nr:BIRC4 [Mytilus edulis]
MDAVRCSSCHIVIEKEELMSDLSVIHARFSPFCTLIMQHINKDRLTIIQNSWKQSFIPMYPNYIIENDRRNTFSEVFGKISSERLSHAVKDKGRRIAICHCCGLSMLPWKLQLGPWEADALLRNFCTYLEVRKGPKYILDITKTLESRNPGIKRELRSYKIEDDLYHWETCTRKEMETKHCVKCNERKKSMMFNCGHRLTCKQCASWYFVCPYCHTPVTLRVETYY